ncbi:MAG: carboxymuconolactone decarboxylase family protein [Actinobacteria bacterium]|nr:carboxymuconolactone decarboxylase family protein [Actinomycetota bacterium]
MTDQQAPVVPPSRTGDVADLEKAYKHLGGLEADIKFDNTIRELVKLRASILNGCAFCVDMHTTDGRRHGESDRRLAVAGAWRHAPFFTARERAALALTDAVTMISNRNEGVPEDVWAEAKAQFPPEELGNLLSVIVAINAWNRLAVTLLQDLPAD